MRALYARADGQWKNDLMNSLVLTTGKKLTYTPTVSGNQRQFTIMCNVRRIAFGAAHYILSGGTYCYWYFDSDDTLRWNGTGVVGAFHSTRKFRDTEWMFVGLAVDTVARTVKMVVNDQEIDDWALSTLPTQNAAVGLNLAGTAMQIGEGELELSDFVILDGEVLTPQEMINYRTQTVPFGNNVITTTKKFTTEGAQERFFNWAKNNSGASDPILSNEGQTVSSGTVAWRTLHTPVLPDSGKYQIEMTVGSNSSYLSAGTQKASFNTNTVNQSFYDYAVTGGTGVYYARNGADQQSYNNSQSVDRTLTEFNAAQTGDRVSFYIDMDNRKMYYAFNGVLATGHDPISGTGGWTITDGDVRFYSSYYDATAEMELNIGKTDYEYPVTGYGALKEPAKLDLKRCKLLPTSGSTQGVLSDRGLRNSATGASFIGAYSNFVLSSGKIYFEAGLENPPNSNAVGIAAVGNENYSTNEEFVGGINDSIGLYQGNSLIAFKAGSVIETFIPGTASQTLTFAVDLDVNKFWMGSDGVWQDGNPTTGTGGHTITDTAYRVMVNSYNTGVLLNFGDSSWKHTPPTGFSGPAHLDFDTLRAPQSDGEHLEYGPNGGQLLFENGGQIGEITAGNLVTWTPTGITTDDQLTDTPGDPYAVLSSMHTYGTNVAISEGGLRTTVSSTATDRGALTNIPADFPIYFEFTVGNTLADNNLGLQMCPNDWDTGPYPTGGFRWQDTGNINQNGGSAGSTPAWSNGNVMMVAYSPADGMAWFGRNGSWHGNTPVIGGVGDISGLAEKLFVATNHYAPARYLTLNFGQRPFEFTPPEGFLELKSSSLPTPQYHGRDKFDVAVSVGTGAPRDIYTSFDQIGLVWGKARSSAYSHRLEDRLRGAGKGLFSNTTAAEEIRTDSITDFSPGGFSFGVDAGSGYNQNGVSYAYWIFGNDGTEVTNNDGTIPSQVIADSSGYFSIATITGNQTDNQTFGHGLDRVPEMVIGKSLASGMGWPVWHKGLTSDRHGIFLNSNAAENNPSTDYWRPELATNSVMGLGSNDDANDNGQTVLFLCFVSILGLSKVFFYEGEGSSDGPFVDCGFKPRWILLKRIDGTGNWVLHDATRDGENPSDALLNPNTSSAEASFAGLDITANGFKIRTTDSGYNTSGDTYIGLAIADVAGGGNLPAILGN